MTKQTSLADLGARAVACKHWRWMPGMLLLWKLHERGGIYRGRVCHLGSSDSDTEKDVYCEGRGDRFDGILEVPNCYPDLSDPATLGCVLALVEGAYGACDLNGRGHPSDLLFTHRLYPYDHDGCFEGKTRAEALVVALEAAP